MIITAPGTTTNPTTTNPTTTNPTTTTTLGPAQNGPPTIITNRDIIGPKTVLIPAFFCMLIILFLDDKTS